MKYVFISLFALSFNSSFAESTRTVEAGCIDGSDCSAREVQNALTYAEQEAIKLFESASRLADKNQSEICQNQIQKFRNSCNQAEFDRNRQELDDIKLAIESRESLIEEKKQQIEQKINNIATTGQLNRVHTESPTQATEIIEKLSVLKSEIEILKTEIDSLKKELVASQVFVNQKSAELRQMREKCSSESTAAETVCQAPTAVTNGETTMIVENSLERSGAVFVEPGEAISGQATAVSIVAANGSITAPLVEGRRASFDRVYATTMESSEAAAETLNSTFTVANETSRKATTVSQSADDSITQINTIITSLTPLTGGATFQDPGGVCIPMPGVSCPPAEEPPAGAPIEPIVVTPLDPAEGGGGSGDGGRGTGTGTGGRGTASAEELGDQALSGAYGADSSGTGDTSNKTTGAATNPNGGGLAGALSGLSSMFGKTSGGFGDSSSYGSNYGSTRYGSNNSGGTNYNKNSGTYYNNASNPAFKSAGGIPQTQGQNRGFQQQFGGSNQGSGIGQGQAGSGLSGFDSSGSGGLSNEDSKPGLLSRLFGKKDKNMFGKTTSSGGGGSMQGTSSKTGVRGASGLINDSMDPSNPNNPTGRTFDPNKYMPSKEAEERAYLRSTGRKMASRGLASAADFQWPDDISRNKNLNLFKTVNLIHRAKLAQ